MDRKIIMGAAGTIVIVMAAISVMNIGNGNEKAGAAENNIASGA